MELQRYLKIRSKQIRANHLEPDAGDMHDYMEDWDLLNLNPGELLKKSIEVKSTITYLSALNAKIDKLIAIRKSDLNITKSIINNIIL
jgi:hypothetical protein